MADSAPRGSPRSRPRRHYTRHTARGRGEFRLRQLLAHGRARRGGRVISTIFGKRRTRPARREPEREAGHAQWDKAHYPFLQISILDRTISANLYGLTGLRRIWRRLGGRASRSGRGQWRHIIYLSDLRSVSGRRTGPARRIPVMRYLCPPELYRSPPSGDASLLPVLLEEKDARYGFVPKRWDLSLHDCNGGSS